MRRSHVQPMPDRWITIDTLHFSSHFPSVCRAEAESDLT